MILFVGFSGSGKDTLMVKCRDQLLSEGYKVYIAKRWITRPAEENNTEKYTSVTDEDFQKGIETNKFVLHWEIYGNKYGIPKTEIDDYLKEGFIVLVNLSRSKLYEFKKIYPSSRIVLVEVPEDVAEDRIKLRKRKSEHESMVNERIKRLKASIDMPMPDLIINNSGEIDTSIIVLSEFLRASLY